MPTVAELFDAWLGHADASTTLRIYAAFMEPADQGGNGRRTAARVRPGTGRTAGSQPSPSTVMSASSTPQSSSGLR
jgi:hypothetical protein